MARFDKKWFNPLYFILNDIVKIPTIRTVLVYGGKSSSKTVTICQILSKECYVKNSNSISFRKESVTIPTTIKKSFNLAMSSMYLDPAFDKQDRRYLCATETGEYREMVMKGMDDSEKSKGIESYKYVFFDELNQFLKDEYEQADLSLRGMEGQKVFAAWNPVDENSWVKTDLVDTYSFIETNWELPCPESFVKISTCGKVVLIKTTYQDNFWINGSPDGTYGYRDENLIYLYEALRTKNYNSYKVNVLGEYGKTVFGGEFLKCWRSEQHTGLFPYRANQAVYLYFDENVNPYFPCGIFQVGEDGCTPRMIHCIAAKNPNNKTSWMSAEIRRKLTEWGHKGRVFIGGDATSQKDDVKQEKGHDMFRLIMNDLKEFNPIRKTSVANPSVIMSADFVNSVLDGQVQSIDFGVDKSCRQAIIDFENTKEDKNGKVDKRTITDPVTKVPYQPFGHFCDLLRYFMVDTYPKEYLEYQRGGIGHALRTGNAPKSKNSY